MKILIKLFFLAFIIPTFGQENNEIKNIKNTEEEKFVYGYIKTRGAGVYSQPTFDSEPLKVLEEGDSIKIFNYYKGEPFTKVLFWVTKVGKYNGYIHNYSVQGNLKTFKEELDARRKIKAEQKRIEAEQKKIKELEIARKSCEYEINEKDPFDNTFKKFTSFYKVSGYSLRMQLRRYDSEIYLVVKSIQELGCSSPYNTDRSYVKIQLLNNKILTFYHRGDLDCKRFRVFARITNNEINLLKKIPIKSVRLSGTEFYHDIEEIEYEDFFIDKLKCIE